MWFCHRIYIKECYRILDQDALLVIITFIRGTLKTLTRIRTVAIIKTVLNSNWIHFGISKNKWSTDWLKKGYVQSEECIDVLGSTRVVSWIFAVVIECQKENIKIYERLLERVRIKMIQYNGTGFKLSTNQTVFLFLLLYLPDHYTIIVIFLVRIYVYIMKFRNTSILMKGLSTWNLRC